MGMAMFQVAKPHGGLVWTEIGLKREDRGELSKWSTELLPKTNNRFRGSHLIYDSG